MNDTDINDGRSNSDFVRSCRVIGNDFHTGMLGLLGDLNQIADQYGSIGVRSRDAIEMAIDQLINPYAQLTDCELFDECDCRHCKWCGGYLTDGHKVLWNGPMGWGVCNIDCAKFYAAEFIVANKEAVLY